jgi:NAD(P)-dependent dehydrogenase (short-subunit alcohol dehydrogenase family)
MMRAMTQRVLAITGAGGALGGAVARQLHAAGYALALFDTERAKSRLDSLVGELGGVAFAGDFASPPTWVDALEAVRRALGGAPSHAVLVAGGWAGGAPVHAAKDDAYEAMMKLNVQTTYLGLRSVLPAMVSARHGAVVVVGSRAAVRPWTSGGAAAYAASKAAVVALAETVAAEVLEYGVRVNAILPSTMDTPANRQAMPDADPSKWVSLESAAEVIAFLLSDASRDVSGAALPVYGRA